jgi:feruloyl-CoA synthase
VASRWCRRAGIWSADLDAGEITDKGYVNERQVLANRAALVELLYAEPVPAGVVVAGRTA